MFFLGYIFIQIEEMYNTIQDGIEQLCLLLEKEKEKIMMEKKSLQLYKSLNELIYSDSVEK